MSRIMNMLFLVLLGFLANTNSQTVYQQNGYKMDAASPDLKLLGQQVPLSMKTLIRDGTRIGEGYTVKFGQLVDGMQRDVCAYVPTLIYTSDGIVDAGDSTVAWNPQTQSALFLPNNSTVLVPVTANHDAVLEVSRSPDFNSLMQFNGKLYMAVHHETPHPAEVSFLEIEQSVTGEFSVVSTRRVDFSAYNGTWNSCAGSMTPWGTHLGSQEYDPDARIIIECDSLDCMTDLKDHDSQNIQQHMRYFGYYYGDIQCYVDQKKLTINDIKTVFNPYMYGHIPEIGVDTDGNPTAKLWFTLGRFSHETAVVLPDNKTVYLTDDGTNGGFFKFVANQANDLSSGCIYGTKVTQKADDSFDMSWIQLGCSTNDEIEAIARSGITFADIFTTTEPDTSGSGPICPQGFTSTNVGHDNRLECLSLNPAYTKAAAFLETRRVSALFGGTTEFSKWEGLTYDSLRNRLYHGISEIRYGMEDNMKKGNADTKYDIGGPNDVRLAYNPCGCVYASDLDDNFNAINLMPLVCGVMSDAQSDTECLIDYVAGPDNVVMAGPDAILISEDSNGHVNNFLWMYDLVTGVLTRLASCMYGAEVAGPYYHKNVQGSSYIFYVCQHPYDENFREKVMDVDATGQAGWLNYLGPIPVLEDGESLICDNIEAPVGAAQHQNQATTSCYVGTYQA